MADFIGQSLGRYHILEQLGEGGMATVYKAYDTRLETDVAVKVIRTDELSPKALERALKRFEREAKALARLTHANIVKVTDYGEHEGSPYLVMEYLPGGTLKQKLAGRPMPWQDAVRLLLPIARALDFAHRQGMIHRDVKPSNILITEDGDPLLTDFGVAKILDEESTVDLTGTGAAVGTPEYMAPEQATSKSVDKRADIYSLGIVLYEMLTGRKPFIADTPMAVLIKQATEPLPRPTQFVRDLQPRLEQVLLKALVKNPEERYQSMGEFASALESIAETKSTRLAPKILPRDEKETFKEAITIPPRSSSSKAEKPTKAKEEQARPAASKRTMEGFRWGRWIPIGVLVLLLGAALAIGNGLLGLGKQGIGSTWTRPKDGMVMMFVPAGSFEMGSEDGDSDEQPVHTVTLDAYWMDRTEVTNKMYALCVEAGVCASPQGVNSSKRTNYYTDAQYTDYPVINVDWNQANAYCQWADARLPTEAEWEKAARGTDGRTYPWGEGNDCNKANYYGCVGDTNKVGSYPSGQSPYGIYDMAGNVWEWVADWYDSSYYSISPFDNPPGPVSGRYRALRGGSWLVNEGFVRSSNRGWVEPDFWYRSVGFRCSRGTSP